MLNTFLYSFWTILNMAHDSLFKYKNIFLENAIFFRYLFLIFVSWFFIIFSNKEKKNLLKIFSQVGFFSFVKSILTFFAIIFNLIQLKKGSLVNTALIFYTIPYIDLILISLLKIENNKKFEINFLVLLNLFYLIYNLFFYPFSFYIYGYLSSFFFSLSNILIISNKKNFWVNNKASLWIDLFIFSLGIIFCSYFFFNQNLSNLIKSLNWSLMLLTILGSSSTILLYFFFYRSNSTPTVKLANLDLITGVFLEKIIFKTNPSIITIVFILGLFVQNFKMIIKNCKR